MKQTIIVVFIAVFMATGSLVIPHIACADCGSAKTHCCIDGDKSKTIAVTTFSMCWSWQHIECVPCHGGGQWSYLAKWCNENYAGCKDKCWACFDGNDCCFDKQGGDHNCYN